MCMCQASQASLSCWQSQCVNSMWKQIIVVHFENSIVYAEPFLDYSCLQSAFQYYKMCMFAFALAFVCTYICECLCEYVCVNVCVC